MLQKQREIPIKIMRIAFLTEYDAIGGGESNLMNLCSELAKSAEVVLFCDGKLYDYASSRGINVRRASLSGRRWVRFFPLPALRGSLQRELEGFDVIHAYSLNVLPRLFFVRRPVVWTTHGYWERPNGLRARIIDLFVDRIVTVSSDVDQCATFSNKQRKIYLGASIDHQKAEKKPFDPCDIHLVCVGRFQRIKGQDLLLDAVGRLARENLDRHITLDFIGDVNGNGRVDLEYKDRLFAIAREQNISNLDIRFMGFQKNPGAYIQAADIVVVPSRYESFSMVAIEALSFGKPVIAPNIGGPKDIIDRAEIGQLFEAGDAESLCLVLKKTIDRYQDFSFNLCLERANNFSVKRQATEHMSLYREFIGA